MMSIGFIFWLLIYSIPGSIILPAPVSAKVKAYQGKPTIHLDGVPVSPVMYGLTDVPGGRWSWEEVPQHNIKMFCEQGIELFQLDVSLEQMVLENGKVDISLARRQVQGVLNVCPNARVFFRLHLNPPGWWMDQHPEESVAYDSVPALADPNIGFTRSLQADARNPIRPGMASSKWKEWATQKLALFCRLFSKVPEGNVLAGIQVAYGIYGEWHQWGLHLYEADFSKAMTLYYRNWLTEKYGRVENLQAAWGNAEIDFSEVVIPNTPARMKTSAGMFRHPVKERTIIDYYECQHELVADNIIHFCKKIKETWPRPIITGTFYGYFFSVFNRQAAAGHLALQKVLNSPDVDYLSGPQVYYPEEGYQPGEPYRSRSLIHSVLLHGKLWLDEFDQQPRRSWPYLSTYDNRERYNQIVQENISTLQRSVLFPLLRGQGLWFYDFGPAGMHLNTRNQRNSQAGTTGYWDNPQYLEEIGKLKAFADQFLHQPYTSRADVLAVYDTESIYYMPSTKESPCPITEHLINWSTLALYYAGCLFDPIHLDDLDKVDLKQYKAVVFMNTFLLNEAERSLITDKVAKDNRHLIWTYAPGYLNEKNVSVNLISAITNIKLDTLRSDSIPTITLDSTFVECPAQMAKGKYAPVFYINDENVKVLGHYKEKALAGFGYQRASDHTSWYAGLPITDFRIFQEIFKNAGVTLYTMDKEIIYGGGDHLMYHTTEKGQKTFEHDGQQYNLEFTEVPATKLLNLSTGKEFWK